MKSVRDRHRRIEDALFLHRESALSQETLDLPRAESMEMGVLPHAPAPHAPEAPHRAEEGVVRVFLDDRYATGREHPSDLAEDLSGMLNVLQHLRTEDEIEDGVFERESVRVCVEEREMRVAALPAADGFAVDINARALRLGATLLHFVEEPAARAADVEDAAGGAGDQAENGAYLRSVPDPLEHVMLDAMLVVVCGNTFPDCLQLSTVHLPIVAGCRSLSKSISSSSRARSP